MRAGRCFSGRVLLRPAFHRRASRPRRIRDRRCSCRGTRRHPPPKARDPPALDPRIPPILEPCDIPPVRAALPLGMLRNPLLVRGALLIALRELPPLGIEREGERPADPPRVTAPRSAPFHPGDADRVPLKPGLPAPRPPVVYEPRGCSALP